MYGDVVVVVVYRGEIPGAACEDEGEAVQVETLVEDVVPDVN